MGLVTRWTEYLRGYVVFRVVGEGIERFANLAGQGGVRLRALRRLGSQVAVGRAIAGDFRRLRRPAVRAGVQLRIVRRGGLPFLWARLRRRPGLLGGALLAIALVLVLGARVWEVQVHGVEAAEARRVRQVLARLGLRPGVVRPGLDLSSIERELLVEIPSLAWADVRLRGAVAVVEVRPRRDAEAQALRSGDIVATHDGLVTQVLAAAGWPVVQPGEVVRRGQVLISGQPPPGWGRALRASGWVRARVWAEGYGESRLFVEVERPAGPAARGWLVEIGPWRLSVGAVAPPFRRFRSRVTAYRLPGPAGSLPVSVQAIRYEPLERSRIPIGLDAARRMAEEAALGQASEGLGPGAEVLQVLRRTWEEPGGDGQVLVRSRVLVEATLDIGRFRPHAP